jgi:DNA primase
MTKEQIDDIKYRNDIVGVVSNFTELKQCGRSLKGLCPFHEEKTPSFHVWPESQSFRCFGQCGVGGDIITFVSMAYGYSFIQAVEFLGGHVTATIPSRPVQQHKPHPQIIQINKHIKICKRLRRINILFQDYWAERLRQLDNDLRSDDIELVDYYTQSHCIEHELFILDEKYAEIDRTIKSFSKRKVQLYGAHRKSHCK